MLTVSKNYFLTHPPKSNSYTTFDPGTQTIIFNTFSHHGHRTAEHRTPSALGLNFTCFTFTVIFDHVLRELFLLGNQVSTHVGDGIFGSTISRDIVIRFTITVIAIKISTSDLALALAPSSTSEVTSALA